MDKLYLDRLVTLKAAVAGFLEAGDATRGWALERLKRVLAGVDTVETFRVFQASEDAYFAALRKRNEESAQ